MTRRVLLERAAVLTGGGVALGLGACSSNGPTRGPHADEVARTSIAIDYASYYPPVGDLRRLVLRRAAARRASVLFSEDAAGASAQVASLRKLTAQSSGFRVVVVAPFDVAAVAPVVADALGRDVKVVGFGTALARQTAAITVDAEAAAARLVADVRRHAGGRDVVVLVPPARPVVPDPFLAYGQRASRALVAALQGAGIRVGATTTAVGTADAAQALRAAGGAGVVLAWNTETALGAAQVVDRDGYVGAIGAPAVSTAAALRAVDGDGPLRCLVAARLSDLAGALVDLPLALAQGRSARSVVIAPQSFVRGAPATRAALADYAGD